MNKEFSEAEIDRIIGTAWEDRTTSDAIKARFGISEYEVVKIMRRNMKPPSFMMWRKRVHGRKTKHQAVGNNKSNRFTSPNQLHQDRFFSYNIFSLLYNNKGQKSLELNNSSDFCPLLCLGN